MQSRLCDILRLVFLYVLVFVRHDDCCGDVCTIKVWRNAISFRSRKKVAELLQGLRRCGAQIVLGSARVP